MFSCNLHKKLKHKNRDIHDVLIELFTQIFEDCPMAKIAKKTTWNVK